ncbi:PorT family protein [Weeksellaceae bacterium TAE3-ERU29]|nr:PorT family protein [Weeksellaceae bacterium TAE3-ERU29]
MKKLVLSAAVAFAGIVGLNAQSMESLQIGAKAGYNYSTLRGDAAKDLNTKGMSGFNVGLFVEIPVNERFSIQPEVNYSVQGAKWEGNFAGIAGGSRELKAQYINVPVLAKFYIADGFSIQAGPQVGFLTGATTTTSANLLGVGGTAKNDKFNENMGKVDFSAVVGAGYKLPMGFTIDARYALGFTNVFDKDNNEVKNLKISENNDFKNGVFSVGVGYQF